MAPQDRIFSRTQQRADRSSRHYPQTLCRGAPGPTAVLRLNTKRRRVQVEQHCEIRRNRFDDFLETPGIKYGEHAFMDPGLDRQIGPASVHQLTLTHGVPATSSRNRSIKAD